MKISSILKALGLVLLLILAYQNCSEPLQLPSKIIDECSDCEGEPDRLEAKNFNSEGNEANNFTEGESITSKVFNAGAELYGCADGYIDGGESLNANCYSEPVEDGGTNSGWRKLGVSSYSTGNWSRMSNGDWVADHTGVLPAGYYQLHYYDVVSGEKVISTLSIAPDDGSSSSDPVVLRFTPSGLSPVDVDEGGTGNLTIQRDGDTSSSVTLELVLQKEGNISAAVPSDVKIKVSTDPDSEFQNIPCYPLSACTYQTVHRVTIPAGESELSLRVRMEDDITDESNEIVYIGMRNTSEGSIASGNSGTATFRIIDNDDPGNPTIIDPKFSLAEGGNWQNPVDENTTMTLRLNIDETQEEDVSIEIVLMKVSDWGPEFNSTADPNDFRINNAAVQCLFSSSGTCGNQAPVRVTVPAGQTGVNLSLYIRSNTGDLPGSESIHLGLRDPSHGAIDGPNGVVRTVINASN